MKSESAIIDNVFSFLLLINERVAFLKKISNDFFQSQNSTFNENFQITGSIIEKTEKLNGKYADEQNNILLSQIENHLHNSLEQMAGLESRSEVLCALLARIEVNLSKMFGSVVNFRQNLDIMKPLLSELRLLRPEILSGNNTQANTDVIQHEKGMDKLIASCPALEENIYNIRRHIEGLRSKIVRTDDDFLQGITEEFENIIIQTGIFRAIFNSGIIESERIDRIKKNYNDILDSQARNLHRQDILKQYFEHIHNSSEVLSNELREIIVENSVNTDNQCDKLALILKMTDKNSYQLVRAQEEFKQIAAQISKNATQIRRDIDEITGNCKMIGMSGKDLSYSAVSVWKGQLDDYIAAISERVEIFLEISEELVLINKITADIFNKYIDVSIADNIIEQSILDRINVANLLVSEDTEVARCSQNILKYYAANHLEKNRIKELYENTSNEIKRFLCKNMEYGGQKKVIESLKISTESINVLANLIVNNINTINSLQKDIWAGSEQGNSGLIDCINNKYPCYIISKVVDNIS